jgi:alcohol dehydrogenase/L-iditol 2-dehydrogenase
MVESKMPAVVQYASTKGAVELREVPVPKIGPREVLLEVAGVGVCGSDVHQYQGTHSWPVNLPVTLGHEFCGRVAAAGPEVKSVAEGDFCVSETAAQIDEDSPMSRAGKYNLDPARLGFGYGLNGAMARYVKVPVRTLHKVPGKLEPQVAAITEPCCVSYQCVVVNSHVRPGDLVVVMGPGPIGMLCTRIARLCGAGTVILTGMARDRARLAVGRAMGATHTAEVESQDVAAMVRDLGDGLGADLVVDATGASAPLAQALEWVRPAGQITKVGWGPQPLGFSLDPLVKKAVTLQGSFSHNWPVWERVLRLLTSGQLDPRPIISRFSPLTEWRACFDGMHEGALIKAVLRP